MPAPSGARPEVFSVHLVHTAPSAAARQLATRAVAGRLSATFRTPIRLRRTAPYCRRAPARDQAREPVEVVLPDEPPVLGYDAARAILRILSRAAASMPDQGSQAGRVSDEGEETG